MPTQTTNQQWTKSYIATIIEQTIIQQNEIGDANLLPWKW